MPPALLLLRLLLPMLQAHATCLAATAPASACVAGPCHLPCCYCARYCLCCRPTPPALLLLHLLLPVLQAHDIIASYNIPLLLKEYLINSREWMLKEVEEWLVRGPAASPGAQLFVLLADPGMGKSVFSAVLTSAVLIAQQQQGGAEGGSSVGRRVQVRVRTCLSAQGGLPGRGRGHTCLGAQGGLPGRGRGN